MKKTKIVLAVGIIFLFLGLSFSPVTAKVSLTSQQEIIGLRDALQTRMSSEDQRVFEQFLPLLTERMQAATSYDELVNVLQTFMKDWGHYPLVGLLLHIVFKLVTWENQLNKLRPVRHSAFIMSWGSARGLLPSRENRLNLHRSLAMWYYSGKSNLMNSRTLIIDFSPFNIKTISGRQLGFMQNFFGLYVYRHQTILDNSFTLMLGHGKTIRGFDLSPFGK